MPRKPYFPPRVYPHKSGQARCRINGHDVYLGVYGSDDAARAYADLITRMASGQSPTEPARTTEPVKPTGVTVSVMVARWMDEEGPKYAQEGREVVQFELSVKPLIRLYGGLPAKAFDCDCLERVQLAAALGSWRTAADREWCEKRGSPAGWSRKVVNRRIVRIRTIFRWGERKKLVNPGTFAHLCTLPGLTANDARARHIPRRKAATMAEVNRVLKHLPPVGRAMLLLQWWTGMRSAEVRTMQVDELDMTGAVWIYRPAKHKRSHAGQSRAVPIGVRGQAVLRQWVERDGEFVFPPSKRRKLSHYSRDTYAQMIRRAALAAGLPGFCGYQCRHAAKQRVTRAIGLDAARAYLGQRSLDVANTYGDALDMQSAIDAAKRLG